METLGPKAGPFPLALGSRPRAAVPSTASALQPLATLPSPFRFTVLGSSSGPGHGSWSGDGPTRCSQPIRGPRPGFYGALVRITSPLPPSQRPWCRRRSVVGHCAAAFAEEPRARPLEDQPGRRGTDVRAARST